MSLNNVIKKEPIRILQMVASLDFGGSQNMIVNLYKAIDRNEIQFDFIVDHPNLMGLEKTVRELGAKIYVVPEFKGYNIMEVKKAWNDLFEKHPEYKVLHSHARSYASIYLPIAKKHGLKTIIHSHNTSNGSGIKSKIKDLFQLPIRRQADYFIGCSYNAGLWLFGRKVCQSDRFKVLNNAIDVEKFKYNEDTRKKYRKEFNVEDKKVLIQVGAFREQKNYPFTLDLMTSLNDDYHLFIVGNGPLKELIDKTVIANNISKKVTVLLDRQDVNNLLQMADIYLMPSNYEGLSVAAIEAQASGNLCLLSDTVSKDVKVSEVVKFLPLYKETWTREITNCKLVKTNTEKDITKAGFNIKETSAWLSNFYKELSK